MWGKIIIKSPVKTLAPKFVTSFGAALGPLYTGLINNLMMDLMTNMALFPLNFALNKN